ncbi:MAG: YihY family inner membrane protein [Gammaproteobacteria bacterium]|nr:YihY family inner membrane protein [Gammaproteobacteria bacterium]MBU1625544.1 YihY family inner membrane protein [Gammaproteobacteria bacterium]MBU1980804.1 YihY family inner membrane protein [Gammaproteobacteria bacterium]
MNMERLKQDVLDALRFLRFVALRLRDDRCLEMAASLTFTTLLSLVPLITIMLTVFAAFPVFSDMSNEIRSYVQANMLPETGGKMISRYVEQFAQSASRLTAMGITFLAIAAMMMMMTIDNAFHRIYRVSRQRKLLQRILVYWAVITLAPLLVGASLSITSWLATLSSGYTQHVPFGGMTVLKLFPVILTAAAFTLLFSVVPNRYVPIRHALIGGVIAAVAFESMNLAFAYYIKNFPTYKLVYGAFASLPIFLLWIYLSWLMLLFGAIISAALPHWRSEHSLKKDQATQLYFALHMLKFMDEGLKTGEVQVLHDLSRKLRIGYEEVERILQRLSDAKMVSKLSDQGWGMVRAPEYVTVSELIRLFLLDTSVLPKQSADPHIEAWFTALEQRMHKPEQQTLRDIWATLV